MKCGSFLPSGSAAPEGNLNAPHWLQLMAGLLFASSLGLPVGLGSGLAGAGHVLVGQDKRPEACLPPAHLALRTHSICGPHPSPGLIRGWQQPGEQKVCLSPTAAPPPPPPPPQPQPGTPLRGSFGCQDLGSLLPWHRPEMRLWGAGRGGAGRAVRDGEGPELCSCRGAGAPAGAGLDPEHSGPVAEPATHLASLILGTGLKAVAVLARARLSSARTPLLTHALSGRLCGEVAGRF